MAIIILPKLPTFLGNFCMVVEIFHPSSEILFGQLLKTFGDFLLVMSSKCSHITILKANVDTYQCDQIWRKFAALAKLKDLGIFKELCSSKYNFE